MSKPILGVKEAISGQHSRGSSQDFWNIRVQKNNRQSTFDADDENTERRQLPLAGAVGYLENDGK